MLITMDFSMIDLSLSALEAILKFIYNAKTILKTLQNILTKMKLKTDKNEVQTMEVIIVIHCLCCQFKKNNKN